MSSIRLSERLSRLTPSATTALGGKVAALKAQGINVISFGAGEPDFATPDAIKAAGIKAIETNQTKYTPIGGPAELFGQDVVVRVTFGEQRARHALTLDVDFGDQIDRPLLVDGESGLAA